MMSTTYGATSGAINCSNSNKHSSHLSFFRSPKDPERLQPDFMCNRGLLSTVMCTPYEQMSGWIICASRVNGTIFLYNKKQEQIMTQREETLTSYGYKFEQYMTSDRPDSWPSIAEPVNEGDGFFGVFESRLNKHTLIYGAEIDGIESKEAVSNLKGVKVIELKTSYHLDNHHQRQNFSRFKTMKWWAQSILVGIEKVVCGFRDDRGIVSELKHYEVVKLPEMGNGSWDQSVCMNFCDQFLSYVKNVLQKEDSPHVVWKFEWKPGGNVRGVKYENPTEFYFLPDWFLTYVSSTNKTKASSSLEVSEK